MSLFSGEKPVLGTTVIKSSNGADSPLTVQADNGVAQFTVSNAGNVTFAGSPTITGSVTFANNVTVTGTSTLTGAASINGGATVATGQTLTVTDTDALLVGGNKIPKTWTVDVLPHVVTPATAGWAWIANRACKVVSVNEVHSAGASGVTLNVRKVTDASAPSAAAGTTVKELLSAGLNANFTANTVSAGSLSATASDYTFAAGDKLAWNASGALTSYQGAVTIEFQAV